MHVGRKCNKNICPELSVDGWKVCQLIELETGNVKLEEEYTGMVEVQAEEYLGAILSSHGKNLKNVTARKNRGIGIVNQIMEKLSDLCFGKHYFKVEMI